jgi:phage/plasmid-associated DNA primase
MAIMRYLSEYIMIGYILSNDTAAKKLFVLGRAQNSGKSSLCEFIKSLFNSDAVTSIPLGEIGDKFVISELHGKALCINAELPACKISSKTAAAIKSCTGNDFISSALKYKNERKKFRNRAKFLFATNHMIEIDPKEVVLKGRFLCIPTVNTIPPEQRIFNILRYFEHEKPLIVLKSIGFYRELRMNNYEFSGDFPLDDIIHCEDPLSTTIGELKKNAVEKFIYQRCSFTNFDKYTPTDMLYEAYCDFCYLCNYDTTFIVDYNYFSKLLNKICGKNVQHDKRRIEGYASAISLYMGIVLKTE